MEFIMLGLGAAVAGGFGVGMAARGDKSRWIALIRDANSKNALKAIADQIGCKRGEPCYGYKSLIKYCRLEVAREILVDIVNEM